MTREEVLAMKPGPILEYHVAVNVMGFSPSQMRDGWVKIGSLATYPKQYSTEMSAAWEVQEKLQGYGGMVLGCYGSKSGARWFAVQTTVGSKEINVTCHTAPEAICKAALLAVMEVSA